MGLRRGDDRADRRGRGRGIAQIRPLDGQTLPEAQPLREEWGYTEELFAELVDLCEGCARIAYEDGEAVAMTFAFPWGPVGWIGSVLTLPEHRGEGIGQAVTEAGIEALQEAGCRTVKLYATPKAIALYERIGFTGEAEFTVARGGARRGRDPEVEPLAEHADAMRQLDREVFDADRSRFLEAKLEAYPETCVAVTTEDGRLAGYGIARPGTNVTEIGPVVARRGDANVAQRLVDGLLSRLPDQEVEVTYPSQSWAASSSWSCRGFVGVDQPLQMRLGPATDERRESIVAAGGQDVG